MIKAILFDVGGTLITPKPNVGAIYAEVALKFGVKESPVELNQRFKKAFKRAHGQQKPITFEWWKDLVEDVFNRHQFREFDLFYDALYREFAKKERWTVFDDVFPALETFKNDGYILGLASNWDERLPGLLDDLALSSLFTHRFISYEMGCQKPQPLFYEKSISALALKPEEILHVGDDKENDLEGPLRAGMKAVLLDRKNEVDGWPKTTSLEKIFLD